MLRGPRSSRDRIFCDHHATSVWNCVAILHAGQPPPYRCAMSTQHQHQAMCPRRVRWLAAAVVLIARGRSSHVRRVKVPIPRRVLLSQFLRKNSKRASPVVSSLLLLLLLSLSRRFVARGADDTPLWWCTHNPESARMIYDTAVVRKIARFSAPHSSQGSMVPPVLVAFSLTTNLLFLAGILYCCLYLDLHDLIDDGGALSC